MMFPEFADEPMAATQSLRVVHVVFSLDPGGLERVVVDLVREARWLGQLASVICLERPGALESEMEALRVPVFCAEKRPGLRPEVVGCLRTLFRVLQPDVVHTHQIGALFYAGPAARRCRVPLVVHTEHGKNYAGRRRTRWLGRLAGRYAQRFFSVSRDIAEELTACRIVPRKKIVVVPNGVDVARFQNSAAAGEVRRELGIPPGAPIIGAVGRLNEIKRHDLLVGAFARLKLCHPDAHLLLVGDGPRRTELEKLAALVAPAGSVHFVGYQPSPERFLQAMDVMALTSRSEGMPLAVLEAWAAGVPVVASRVGGVPELIAEEETGLLVEYGDVEGLTAAVGRLLTDAALAQRLRNAARARVAGQHSLKKMAATYQEQYEELLVADSATAGPQGLSDLLRFSL